MPPSKSCPHISSTSRVSGCESNRTVRQCHSEGKRVPAEGEGRRQTQEAHVPLGGGTRIRKPRNTLSRQSLYGCERSEERDWSRPPIRHAEAARYSQGGPIMFTATYPAVFLREDDGKGFHVRFPDLPEALTGGSDLSETQAQAADCLAEALAGRIRRGDAIPKPSRLKRGQHSISVPLYLAPKLALYLAMRESGLRNTDVAKRLGVSETVVRRMLDPKHNTKPEKI